MRPTFSIRGKAETKAAFGELKKATARAAMYRPLLRAGKILDAAWRPKAPRQDPPHLALSGGIVKTAAAEGDRAFARAKRAGFDDGSAVQIKRDTLRSTQTQRGFAEIAVGPGRNPQAIQQEFGNANMAAQPYFRPALDETEGEIRRTIEDGVGVELEKAKARAAAKVARLAAKA
jgi:HK97 gp10 family phage protein